MANKRFNNEDSIANNSLIALENQQENSLNRPFRSSLKADTNQIEPSEGDKESHIIVPNSVIGDQVYGN